MSDTKFIDGFGAFKPHANSPDFIKATVSIDLKTFFEFAKIWKTQNPNEKYLRIDIKESQKGQFYAAENTFKPQKQGVQDMKQAINQPSVDPDFNDDLPPF